MKVLLVDDHSLFRAGMGYVLKELDPELTLFEASECKQAMDIINSDNQLDLILLDLNMPGLAGFACINQVMLHAGDTPVAVLSADDRAETIKQAMQLGVKGYIQKSGNEADMLQSIKRILSGDTCMPDKLDEDAELALANSPIAKLTKRQREILCLIVEGKSNKQIAAVLGITEGTTRIHVTTIFKTLGVRSRSEAVYKALDLGLKYQGPDMVNS
jgi:DNA-binding NarL/FixJ family response regulator